VPAPVLLDQDLGPGRDGDLEGLAVGSVPERTLPVAATTGLEMRAAAEALQIAARVVADEHDVAAATAVAAVGSALGHVRLAAEAETSVSPAAGLDVDASTILHGMILAAGRLTRPPGRLARMASGGQA
jgi:hypothetical protein